MSLHPRPEIENIKVCHHGGLDYAELRAMGLAPEDVVDFSVCCNPFMPPSAVREILNSIAINQYPDPKATELRQCLSQKLGVAPDNILAGNGAVELIRLIALTYFRPGDPVLILKPTFGEYEVACQIVGAEVIEHRVRAEERFELRIEEVVNLIQQHRPRGVFICNPNNPTGQYLSRQEVKMILDTCGDSLFILDEAYTTFVDEGWASLDLIRRGNVIILRSMTKDYALAGLRLGYAIANEEIINALRRVCPPWNVNIAAQKAGAVAVRDDDFLKQCKQRIKQSKQFLTNELRRIGLPPLPSSTNFFLVRVGGGKAFRQALLKHGILVRDCASFGLPEYVRIALRTMPECRKLITAIQNLKYEGELNDNI
ncbi:Histidinol-phosphate aminotransferase [subsurface metagenome]